MNLASQDCCQRGVDWLVRYPRCRSAAVLDRRPTASRPDADPRPFGCTRVGPADDTSPARGRHGGGQTDATDCTVPAGASRPGLRVVLTLLPDNSRADHGTRGQPFCAASRANRSADAGTGGQPAVRIRSSPSRHRHAPSLRSSPAAWARISAACAELDRLRPSGLADAVPAGLR